MHKMRDQNIPKFLMLLCFLSLIPGAGNTVICLEGNGNIAIESIHYDQGSSYTDQRIDQPKILLSQGLTSCPSTCHSHFLSCLPPSLNDLQLPPLMLSEKALLADTLGGLYQLDYKADFGPQEDNLPPLRQDMSNMKSVILLI